MPSNKPRDTDETRDTHSASAQDVLRLIFADDSPIYREQESALLRQFSSIDLVGVAASGMELLHLAKSMTWDVALLDIAMPEIDGIETLKRLLEIQPDATVVMLTAFERPHTLREALAAGAKGFLTKETSTAEIVTALHRAYHGKAVFDERPIQILQDYYVLGSSPQVDHEFAERLERLPQHLRKVVDYLADSYTNREIARATGLSEHTVGSYVRDAITLLEARRGEIAVKMQGLNRGN
ncbi:response regulator transcription factor [Schaalia sp. ZJ405]|uniref:response regulator transcription factor n=1 Tax=Schaalia sp. ZJ405 TaxID=2709403 RepID=UPI0013EE1BA1|nr:response regulator transcription factor [Schaalia sp. ZJ405]QPK81807.1 response regulator transcription factor [Schaalia sp. ZJ405]